MAGTALKGFARLQAAAANSIAGLRSAWQHEEAFRQEVLLLALAVPLSFWVADNPVEQLLLVAVVVLLIIVELLNTAVESVVDRVGLEYHELSGRAKDQASAAVLVAAMLALITWLVIVAT